MFPFLPKLIFSSVRMQEASATILKNSGVLGFSVRYVPYLINLMSEVT